MSSGGGRSADARRPFSSVAVPPPPPAIFFPPSLLPPTPPPPLLHMPLLALTVSGSLGRHYIAMFEATQNVMLKPAESWREALLDTRVMDLFFTVSDLPPPPPHPSPAHVPLLSDAPLDMSRVWLLSVIFFGFVLVVYFFFFFLFGLCCKLESFLFVFFVFLLVLLHISASLDHTLTCPMNARYFQSPAFTSTTSAFRIFIFFFLSR